MESPHDPPLARRSTLAERSPHDALALVALLLLAAAVRVHDLSLGGLWLDEGYSLLQSERSFADILALRRYDANPPLYLLLLHAWRSAFGPSVLAAQAFSAVFGVAGSDSCGSSRGCASGASRHSRPGSRSR